jgi:hypothetical protein
MLDANQAARALYYTEWGLQRENMPYGGQRCWTSNWVPSLWSLREMWPGDNYHLALAYFQTGLADDGWALLRGTFPNMALFGPVPGDLGFPNGGTDFNDCASMFCRTMVEGLFGYRPDYPNGMVTIAPQLPSGWDHAAIKTPDFSLDAARTIYRIELTRPATLDLRLPVRARKLAAMTVNGAPAPRLRRAVDVRHPAYDHCRIDRCPPDRDLVKRADPRLRSLDADAFHSKHAVQGPSYLDCTARFMGDDCVNICGDYHMIMGSQGRELRVLAKHGMNIRPGDPVELVTYEGRRLPDARAVSIQPAGSIRDAERAFLLAQRMNESLRTAKGALNRAFVITLDREVNIPMGGVICSANRIGNGFAVKGCTFASTVRAAS